jgi:glycosyltransferase involved in cell wall biosynthesis
VLLASGYIAGGSLAGVILAFFAFSDTIPKDIARWQYSTIPVTREATLDELGKDAARFKLGASAKDADVISFGKEISELSREEGVLQKWVKVPAGIKLKTPDKRDILIEKEYDIELVIVGRYNMSDNLIRDRILNHKEFGGKLKWFYTGISDSDLEDLYSQSNISVVASYSEGFGLTLEEGLAYGNKVIARDIDVFRERPHANLYFFRGNGLELAETIIKISGEKLDIASISETRTMKDFANEFKNLIYSLH